MRTLHALFVAALSLASAAPALSVSAYSASSSGPRARAAVQTAASATLDSIAEAGANGDRTAVLRLLSESLSRAAGRWRGGAPVTEDEVARLEAEIAFAEGLVQSGWSDGLWARALANVDMPESAPTVRARLARLRGDAASLAVLDAWQVVGPFDNERGRGMTRPTPPESAPGQDEYEGKVRPVRWRPAPAPGADGLLYLGRLVHPSDQVCLLARTWIRSDAAREATLLLSATEEARVWCNGAHLYDALGQHDLAQDAHAVRVQLREGWNELTLKVGGQDGQPVLGARLVDAATGAPLALRSSGAAPEGVAPLDLERVGRRAESPAKVDAPGAHTFLAERGDPESLLRLAILRSVDRAQPRKSRPGHDEALRALEAQPDRLAAALVHIDTIRVAGAIDAEEDANPWLEALRAALSRHGERTRWLGKYAQFVEQSQRLPRRALELIDRALAARPDSVSARWYRIKLLQDVGLGALAGLEVHELAADPRVASWPEAALELSGQFPASDPRSARLLDLAVAAGYPPALEEQERLAEIRSGRATMDGVERRLTERTRLMPYDLGVRVRAMRRWMEHGDAARALGILDEALEICPERPDLHAWYARALLLEGDVQGAIASLERTLEFDRSATDEQRLLDHLRRGAEGGSTSIAEATFHTPFEETLDEVLARRASDEPVADATAPREILLNRLVVEVAPDGRARRYQRIVERVLTAAGARELDRRSFRAFPGDEEVRILSASVRHADGSTELAETGRSGRRGFVAVDLPPLVAGDVVDIEWRRDDLRSSIFGTYFGLDAAFTPDPRLAVRESEIVMLERPGVDLRYHIAGNDAGELELLTFEEELPDGGEQRTFRALGLMPQRPESLEPSSVERTPRVQASTYASWDEFGTWWWNLIREELASSPEIRAKVAELVADTSTPIERLRAIYDFVVTDIRYNAWEFGVHGYQPYSAPVIFSRRFGDCKDKAILLRTMLGEAGIEAWPVVIRSSPRRYEEDLELPLIAHFNHCIAHVPAQEGIPEMFLDGTATLHPLEVLPDSDRGARVVTVRDDGVTPMTVPFASAAENVLRESWTVDLTGDDGAVVTQERAPSGRWDPRERYRFAGDDAERGEAVEQLLTSQFGALREPPVAEHSEYEDLTQPVRVKMEARPERVGREIEGGMELPTTFAPHRLVQGVASESERTTDVLLDVPWSTERTVIYELPGGARVAARPGSTSLSSDDLDYTRTVELEASDDGSPSRVIVRETLSLKSHRIPVDRYPAFRAQARKVDEAQREVIKVEVGQ